jgi:MFS family permease
MNLPESRGRSSAAGLLLLLTAMSMLSAMDRQMLAVLIEPIKAEFLLSDLQIGLVSGLGFSLSFCLLGLPLGRIADRHERRSLVAWTRGIGGLLAAMGGASSGFWSLMGSRAGGALSDAGGAPASLSMIADLYPPAQRSRAMSLFGLGAATGSMLALVLGSWIAQQWGWRLALAIVGGSAALLALLLRMFSSEPLRAQAARSNELSQGRSSVALVWRQPVTRWIMLGAGFALLSGYSVGAWNVSYLVRSHHLTQQQAGWVAGFAALTSVFGSLVAGALTDRLVRRHPGWQMGVPLIGVSMALPSGLLFFAMPTGQVAAATAMVGLFAFFIAWWAAPSYAALSLVVAPQRRATANAMLMLAGAIIGSGIGPIFTGSLSSWLEQWLQDQALRFALICTIAMLVFSVYAFWRALLVYPAALKAVNHD